MLTAANLMFWQCNWGYVIGKMIDIGGEYYNEVFEPCFDAMEI